MIRTYEIQSMYNSTSYLVVISFIFSSKVIFFSCWLCGVLHFYGSTIILSFMFYVVNLDKGSVDNKHENVLWVAIVVMVLHAVVFCCCHRATPRQQYTTVKTVIEICRM